MSCLMIYKEEFHPKIKSDLKKIDKSVVKNIKKRHLDIILNNPLESKKLKGRLLDLYAYHYHRIQSRRNNE